VQGRRPMKRSCGGLVGERRSLIALADPLAQLSIARGSHAGRGPWRLASAPRCSSSTQTSSPKRDRRPPSACSTRSSARWTGSPLRRTRAAAARREIAEPWRIVTSFSAARGDQRDAPMAARVVCGHWSRHAASSSGRTTAAARSPPSNSARLVSSARTRRGPHRGGARPISHTSASASPLTCHGEDFGRFDGSDRACRPPDW
jgi:hypothetical protein